MAKYVTLIVLAISFALPFFWMVTSAIKNDAQIYVVPPVWWPNPQFWNNFYDAWTTNKFQLICFQHSIPLCDSGDLGYGSILCFCRLFIFTHQLVG